MTYKSHWPKKRGRPPSEGTVADRIYKAHQEKARQAERDEPLSDFDKMAVISRLRRRR